MSQGRRHRAPDKTGKPQHLGDESRRERRPEEGERRCRRAARSCGRSVGGGDPGAAESPAGLRALPGGPRPRSARPLSPPALFPSGSGGALLFPAAPRGRATGRGRGKKKKKKKLIETFGKSGLGYVVRVGLPPPPPPLFNANTNTKAAGSKEQMKAMNRVSGKDSLVGINAERSSEAIPLKSVPTLCQFYNARYGRRFFFCRGRWGRCSLPSPRPLCDHQTRDLTDIAETRGREEEGRGKKYK